jgi:hypothetical protein
VGLAGPIWLLSCKIPTHSGLGIGGSGVAVDQFDEISFRMRPTSDLGLVGATISARCCSSATEADPESPVSRSLHCKPESFHFRGISLISKEGVVEVLEAAKRSRKDRRQDPGVAPLSVQDHQRWLEESGRSVGVSQGSVLDAVSQLKNQLSRAGVKGLRAFVRQRGTEGTPSALPAAVVQGIKDHTVGGAIMPMQQDVLTLHAASRGATGSVMKDKTMMWLESVDGVAWLAERAKLYSGTDSSCASKRTSTASGRPVKRPKTFCVNDNSQVRTQRLKFWIWALPGSGLGPGPGFGLGPNFRRSVGGTDANLGWGGILFIVAVSTLELKLAHALEKM